MCCGALYLEKISVFLNNHLEDLLFSFGII